MYEVFNYLWIHRFDVTKAYQLIEQQAIKAQLIDIDVEEFIAKVPTVDLRAAFYLSAEVLGKPGLMVLVPGEDYVIIDGHHRLTRKWIDRVPTMKMWAVDDRYDVQQFYECIEADKQLF